MLTYADVCGVDGMNISSTTDVHYLPLPTRRTLLNAGTQFTCFTSTKVRILTLPTRRALLNAGMEAYLLYLLY